MQDPIGNDGLALEHVLSFEEFTSQGSVGPRYSNFYMFFVDIGGNIRRDPELGAFLTGQAFEQYFKNTPQARAIVRFKKEECNLDRKLVSCLTSKLKKIQTKGDKLAEVIKQEFSDRIDERGDILRAYETELYRAYIIMRSYGFSDKELF